MDLSGIEGLLHSIFLVLSFKAGSHWEISPAESKELSQAIARVARHYPMMATQRGADWMQLTVCVATIGLPRAVQSVTTPRQPRSATGQPRPDAAQVQPQPLAPSVAPVQGLAQGAPRTGGRIETPSQLDPGAMAASHATAPV